MNPAPSIVFFTTASGAGPDGATVSDQQAEIEILEGHA